MLGLASTTAPGSELRRGKRVVRRARCRRCCYLLRPDAHRLGVHRRSGCPRRRRGVPAVRRAVVRVHRDPAGVHRRFPRCRQNTDRCCNLNCRTRRHPTSRRIRGLTRRARTDLWFLGQPDVRGIWIAFFASNVVGAGIAWLWFRRGTWRDGDVRGTSSPSGPELDDADATAGDD